MSADRPADSVAGRDQAQRDEAERVVITDKRKVRPDGSAAPGTPGGSAAAPAAAESGPSLDGVDGAAATDAAVAAQASDDNARLLAERTADLQRISAEYANYRRRAERDRAAAGDAAVGRVLHSFLPILDDLDRARAHGDLTGGLKAVADKLDATFAGLGLTQFGEVGDPFDPAIHDAVMHDESPDVSVPTCTSVLRPGYKHHDRLLRPAMVGVSDPAAAGAADDGQPPSQPPSSETSVPGSDATQPATEATDSA